MHYTCSTDWKRLAIGIVWDVPQTIELPNFPILHFAWTVGIIVGPWTFHLRGNNDNAVEQQPT